MNVTLGNSRPSPRRGGRSRTVLALLFILAGILHFVIPGVYERIVPAYVPDAPLMVALSGAAEIAGGLGLLLPPTRRAAGIGLILLLIAVFPANVEMLRQHREAGGSGPAELVLWLRLPLQLVLIWWAWRASRPAPEPRLL